jgi:hypothetical protein
MSDEPTSAPSPSAAGADSWAGPPPLEGMTEPVGLPEPLPERHPELLVGAAFAGGLLLATLLRRRGD